MNIATSKFRSLFALSMLFLFATTSTFAQTYVPNKLVGAADEGVTIRQIVVMPITDNLQGIYAQPVEQSFSKYVDGNLRWARKEFNPKSLDKQVWSASLLDGNPALVQKIAKAHEADALVTINLTRGPSGFNAQVQLYLAKDGHPFLEESLRNSPMFETSEIQQTVTNLYQKIQEKLPYQGLILSRQGQSVTFNMGQDAGIKVNDELTLIHIIKLNRHPKHHFVISTDKEIIGRIKVYKVDKALSFANIILEKEAGLVQVGGKVMGKGFVSYPSPMVDSSGKLIEGLSQRPDQDIAFGQNPEEWLDSSKPQFGRVGLFLGNSFYNHNTNLNTKGGIPASTVLAPNIAVKGELWFTKDLMLDYKVRQAIFSITNNLGGSGPDSVNMSLSQYGVGLKYNLLMSPDFFGPKWTIGGGFTQSKFDVDDTTPEAYTSNNFGGLHLNLGGQFPLSEELPILFGAEFEYYLTKTLSEGKSSGSPSADITTFQVYGDYLLSPRTSLRGEILFENYSGKMAGTGSRTFPATSTSHRLTTFNVGYNWLF